MAHRGTGCAPGAAGDFISGATFQVIAPITRSSRIQLTLEPASLWCFTGVARIYPNICASIIETARHLSVGPFAVYLERDSTLIGGVGMHSTTSDVIAAARATADAVGAELTAADTAAIVHSIGWPADLAYPGPVFYNREAEAVTETLAWRPRMDIVLTIARGDRKETKNGPDAADSTALLTNLRRAADTGDSALFAEVSSRSAALNPTPLHPQLLNLNDALHGDGLIVSRAGGLTGIIFLNARPDELAAAAAYVAEETPAQVSVQTVTVPEYIR